jgi:hypothetical protein
VNCVRIARFQWDPLDREGRCPFFLCVRKRERERKRKKRGGDGSVLCWSKARRPQ